MTVRLTRNAVLRFGATMACLALTRSLGCADSGDDMGSDGGDSGDGGSGGDDGESETSGITACHPEVEQAGSHTHAFDIPNRDVEGGEEVVYEMTGSGHMHTLTVSKLDFDKLLAGEPVMLETSSDANHSHAVTITCS